MSLVAGVIRGVLAVLLAASIATAAEVIPPAPTNHFNDYAGVVRRETAAQLNRELAQFERDSSNQIVVAIYPRMQSNSSVEDYAVRVAQSWRVGQKHRKNGAVLFVFKESRDIRIVTGYGLEGALPDALCKRIIENEIVPRFRAGDFDGGLVAGVRAMLAATRGEYRGTGRTHAETGPSGEMGNVLFILIIFALLALSAKIARKRRGVVYDHDGRRNVWIHPSSGGRRDSWGSGSSGGGSFSGGGGSFGGGGAGGRW